MVRVLSEFVEHWCCGASKKSSSLQNLGSLCLKLAVSPARGLWILKCAGLLNGAGWSHGCASENGETNGDG